MPTGLMAAAALHERQEWRELFQMVENLEYGTVVTASDLKGRTSLDPIWRVPDTLSGGLRCPGKPSTRRPCLARSVYAKRNVS
jgi:hypothetical protein